MPVLGHAVLGNVQVGHDLDTGNQRLVQSTLQRYIIDDNAVNAHAHLRFALERLDVNIGGAGGDGALDQAVQQADDGRVGVAALLSHVHGELLAAGGGHVAAVGLAGGLAGADLGIIILDAAAQGLQLCQHDLRLHAGQLADVLDGVVVQRVVGGNDQAAAVDGNGQHVVLLGQLAGNLLHGENIHVDLCKIDEPKLQALGQSLQHLAFVDIAKLLQSLADAQVFVLFLVGQGSLQLVLGDIAKVDQDIAKTDVVQDTTLSLSQRITFSCTV